MLASASARPSASCSREFRRSVQAVCQSGNFRRGRVQAVELEPVGAEMSRILAAANVHIRWKSFPGLGNSYRVEISGLAASSIASAGDRLAARVEKKRRRTPGGRGYILSGYRPLLSGFLGTGLRVLKCISCVLSSTWGMLSSPILQLLASLLSHKSAAFCRRSLPFLNRG